MLQFYLFRNQGYHIGSGLTISEPSYHKTPVSCLTSSVSPVSRFYESEIVRIEFDEYGVILIVFHRPNVTCIEVFHVGVDYI